MGTIRDKLEYLNETKNEIRKAIRSKGVEVPVDEPFRNYSLKIRAIAEDANVDVSPLEVTENGEYEPEEGDAYNPVTVNVQPNLKSKVIDKDGTYKASADDCEGFNTVTVTLSDHLKHLSVGKAEIGDTPEKKTFNVKDDPTEGTVGYDEVTVNFDGMLDDEEILVDGTTYGQENTYVASERGLYGYKSFVVTVAENSGPFTVRYWNEHTQLYEETVQKGGSGRYSGEEPTKSGFIFSGWSPDPVNVQRNMDCYACFVEEPETEEGGGSTDMDWEDIANDGGASLNIGEWRTLYGGEISYDGDVISKGWSAKCTLIDKNKDGATSVWAFNLPILGRFYNSDIPCSTSPTSFTGWPGSMIRNLMNSVLNSIRARTDKRYGKAAVLASAIKQVHKYTYRINPATSIEDFARGTPVAERNFETDEYLFIPSYHELKGGEYRETRGPVYNYNLGSGTLTRTSSISRYYNISNPSSPKADWRPIYEDISTTAILYELGTFARPAGNYYDWRGYVYCNPAYDEIYQESHSGKHWWEQTDPPQYTQKFNNITIFFCL